ncbi:MAG: hypothetical protein K6G70_05115 [Bacteroidaceae bacterium]|nr:hypothetical protein [Bacteroidaceae bacterium]
MRKLLLLITVLLTGVSGAWADVTVTISDKTDLADLISESDDTKKETYFATAAHKYGTYSNASGGTTFTTNATSGQSGLTITADGNYVKAYWYRGSANYKFGFAITPTTGAGQSATVTIKAPSGYYIKSYSMTAISTTDKGQFTLAPLGVSGINVSSSLTSINQTVYANTATFTVTRKSDATTVGSELCFPAFTITLASTTMSGDVTLNLNSNNGNKYRSDGTQDGAEQTRDFQTYKSTTTLANLSLSCSGNSMNWTSSAMRIHSNGGTYTLTAPTGYHITGYKISAYAEVTGKKNTIKPSGATTKTLISGDSSDKTIICVNGLDTKSTTFERGYETGGGAAYVNAAITVYLSPTFTVTYKVVDSSGNEMTSEAVEYITTSSPSNPSSFTNAFVTLGDNFYNNSSRTGDPVTSVSAATTLYKLGTVHDCPVEFSTVVSPKWYLIQFGDANKTWYGVNGSTALTIKNQDQYDATDGFSWAFIGNPYRVKIYNKDAEAYINVGTPSGEGVIENPMSTSDGTEWILNGGAKTGVATDFGLQYPGKGLYVNAYNGGNNFALYTVGTSGDRGFTLRVTDLETFDHVTFVNTYIKPYIDSPSNAYYAISSAQATSLSSTYGKESYSASDYKSYLDALNAAIKKPSSGYYVIKNVNTGTYLRLNDVIGVGAANTDANAIIKLTTSGTGFNLQSQGEYIQVPSNDTQVGYSSTPAVLYAFVQSPGVIKVGTTDGAHSYLNYTGGTVKGSAPTTNTGWWILEDAPSSITVSLTPAYDKDGNQNTYATLCVPFNITNLEGANSKTVKAYTPTIDGDYVVPGDGATTITAGTPVILIGSDEGATSVTATIGSTYVTSPVAPTSDHVLTGIFAGTSIDCTAATGTNYVLGFDPTNDRIGFYHVNNAAFPLNANRAYLYIAKGGSVKGFTFGSDGADGIKAIDNTSITHDGPIFNLAGQRISKLQRGVNIVKGKKVVVK